MKNTLTHLSLDYVFAITNIILGDTKAISKAEDYLSKITNFHKYFEDEIFHHTAIIYRQPLKIDYNRYVYGNKSKKEVSLYTIYIFNKVLNGQDIPFPDGSVACLVKTNVDWIFSQI